MTWTNENWRAVGDDLEPKASTWHVFWLIVGIVAVVVGVLVVL